jgi:hypothetical protein
LTGNERGGDGGFGEQFRGFHPSTIHGRCDGVGATSRNIEGRLPAGIDRA